MRCITLRSYVRIMAMMRRAQFAIGLLVTTVVSALAPIPPVRFPSLSPLPILPDENALLREFVSIDFVSINNEVFLKLFLPHM